MTHINRPGPCRNYGEITVFYVLSKSGKWAKKPKDLAEYMEETYEIPNVEVNILDILNTMIAPNNAEASLAANAARENFAACKENDEDH